MDWTKLINPLEAAEAVKEANERAEKAEAEVVEIKTKNKVIKSGDVADNSGSGAPEDITVDLNTESDTKADEKAVAKIIASLNKNDAKKSKKSFVDISNLKEAKDKLNKKLPETLGEALLFPESKKITPELKLEWVTIFFKQIRKQYAGNSKKVKMEAGNWSELDTRTKLEILKSQYNECMNAAKEIKLDETKRYNVKLETYRLVAINPAFLQLINKNAINSVGVEGV